MNGIVEFQYNQLPQPPHLRDRARRVGDYLVARRVRISAFLAAGLVIRALMSGMRPHAIMNRYDVKSLIGFALVLAGVSIRSWAAGVLQKNRELATTGPYAITRNPLYLGSLLILAGFASFLNEEVELIVLAGPLVALYAMQVLHEERRLSNRFDAGWVRYAADVPRFIPRRWPASQLVTWRVQNWRENREYRACTAVLLGLIAMELWRVS